MTALRTGGVDFANAAPHEHVERLGRDEKIHLLRGWDTLPINSYSNLGRASCKDVRVRRVLLGFGIDRLAIAKTALLGLVPPLWSFVPAGGSGSCEGICPSAWLQGPLRDDVDRETLTELKRQLQGYLKASQGRGGRHRPLNVHLRGAQESNRGIDRPNPGRSCARHSWRPYRTRSAGERPTNLSWISSRSAAKRWNALSIGFSSQVPQ